MKSYISNNLFLHLSLLIILGVIVYWNSFNSPFIYDDLPAIVNNKTIHSLDNIKEIIFPPSDTPLAGRPIPSITLAINYHFSGLNSFGYHIVNFIIHIFCSFLLYGIVIQAMKIEAISDKLKDNQNNTLLTTIHKSQPLIAFLIASIWLIHPLNSECVCYITQRTESLMSLAYLATILFTLLAIHRKNKMVWMILASLSCIIGAGCKENIMTAPFLCLLLISLFSTGTMKEKLKKYFPLIVGFLISSTIVLFIILQSPRGGSVGFGGKITSFNYFINQIHMICNYLKLSFYPFPLNIDYGIPIQYSLAETILPFLILLTLFFTIPILFWRKNSLIAYLLLSFFVILSPTSTFVPIATEVAAERRMYLAIIPLLMITSIIFITVLKEINKRVLTILIITIFITLSSITYLRTLDYRDDLRIWQCSTQVLPKNPRSWNSCGLILLERGKLIEAELALKQSLLLNPNFQNALINMGVLKYKKGNYHQAIQNFKKALKTAPNNISTYMNIGASYSALKDAKGLTYYKKALKLSPKDYNIAFNIAILYMKINKIKDAEIFFLKALKLSSNKTSIMAGVGEFYCRNKNYPQGLYYLKQAEKQAPNNIKISNLIKKYQKKKHAIDKSTSSEKQENY